MRSKIPTWASVTGSVYRVITRFCSQKQKQKQKSRKPLPWMYSTCQSRQLRKVLGFWRIAFDYDIRTRRKDNQQQRTTRERPTALACFLHAPRGQRRCLSWVPTTSFLRTRAKPYNTMVMCEVETVHHSDLWNACANKGRVLSTGKYQLLYTQNDRLYTMSAPPCQGIYGTMPEVFHWLQAKIAAMLARNRLEPQDSWGSVWLNLLTSRTNQVLQLYTINQHRSRSVLLSGHLQNNSKRSQTTTSYQTQHHPQTQPTQITLNGYKIITRNIRQAHAYKKKTERLFVLSFMAAFLSWTWFWMHKRWEIVVLANTQGKKTHAWND